jgi:hypothetical protein
MRRMLPLLSLFMLAVWLTATQHCALEQVGLLKSTCLDHCASDQGSHKDGCSTVEDASYKLSGNSLTVAAPTLVQCMCFLCLHHTALARPIEQSFSIRDSSREDRDWIASWHFVRRGAPLPGAPSLFLA